MYNYIWDPETGGYLLDSKVSGVIKEIRPVFYEELDILGFNAYWEYKPTENPLLWAETRRYFYKGELVAEAVGGGLYTKPTLKIHKATLKLEPVSIQEMIKKNNSKMSALIQHTAQIIYDKFNAYRHKVDVIYVAFSGGKDSIVILDLVQKSIPHNEFKVVFADTSMEISDTYKAIEKAKQLWPDLNFYIAKSDIKATDSWEIFGAPSRVLRWCCAVHKSAPSLLKLREITGIKNLKALVFDGIRAEESEMRASYLEKGDGGKHNSQINLHPISNWASSEIFLYIFKNRLLLNKAYRYGSSRIGCIICPLSSEWREFITNYVYKTEASKFLDIIINGLSNKIGDLNERKRYIENGGWKARIDGRDFLTDGNKIIEAENNKEYIFSVSGGTEDFIEWLKPIGQAVFIKDINYIIIYNNKKYFFSLEKTENITNISVIKQSISTDFIHFLYLFKNAIYKTVYCKRCGVCKVECEYGALDFIEKKVCISTNCVNCEACLNISYGCLIAKSKLFITGGKNNMIKGLGNYRGFGFDKIWLDYYFKMGNDLWSSDILGKPKYDAFKIFLRESEITECNLLTNTGKELKRIKINNLNCWAIIIINLIYNSTLFRWFVKNVLLNVNYTPTDLKLLLGDNYSNSTKDNAMDTILKTMRYSPIGSEIGLGVCEIKGNFVINLTRIRWSSPNEIAILYSLYKFAENCDGHYGFTLSYLCDSTIERKGISPTIIFGISADKIKEITLNLSRNYPKFISVDFQKDLDNIDLSKNKTSLDVLKLQN